MQVAVTIRSDIKGHRYADTVSYVLAVVVAISSRNTSSEDNRTKRVTV